MSRSSSRQDHTLKELPQPQDEVAFGFFTWQDAPTRTAAPSRSITRSSSLRASSNEKLYWKPEQPPPRTATRIMTGLASLEARKAIRLAALGVTENWVSLMTYKMWIAACFVKARRRRASASAPALCAGYSGR